MCGGWIKSHRKILEWQWVHDPPTRDLWWYLLHKAAYEETEVDGIVLHPGECLESLRDIAEFLGFNHQQMRTAQKHLVETGEITVYTKDDLTQKLTQDSTQPLTHPTIKNRTLFKVNKWDEYQPANTTSNTTSNTTANSAGPNPSLLSNEEGNKNSKEDMSGRPDAVPDSKSSEIKEIVDYLNQQTGKHFKPSTEKTRAAIKARMNEGYDVDDFKAVIRIKTQEWKGHPKMDKFLRPETLFGTKFESYLNQSLPTGRSKPAPVQNAQPSNGSFMDWLKEI